MAQPPLPNRPAARPSANHANLVLLFSSLAAGLALASLFFIAQRWIWGPAEKAPEGYCPMGAEEPPESGEPIALSAEERALAFARLRTEAGSVDLEIHFERDVLPAYDEAELYTLRQMGFVLPRAPALRESTASRIAETEPGSSGRGGSDH